MNSKSILNIQGREVKLYINTDKKNSIFLIYSLADGDSGEIRYIGRSSLGIRRPRYHFTNYGLKDNTPKTKWVRKRISEGNIPSIKILEYVYNIEELPKLEAEYIKKYRENTNKLLNILSGDEETPNILNPIIGFNPMTLEFKKYDNPNLAMKDGFNNVSAVIRRVHRTVKGWFFWKETEDPPKKRSLLKFHPRIAKDIFTNKEYYIFNLKNMKIFDLHAVNSCCKRRKKSYGGYNWRYASDKEIYDNFFKKKEILLKYSTEKIRKKSSFMSRKPIVGISINTKKIIKFDSISSLKGSEYDISMVTSVLKNRKKYKGFKWRYDIK